VPRSLFYHSEQELICTFLENVGATPVLSPHTNRKIMEDGVNLAVDETCLPVKIHLGHVLALEGKTDAVLVPRYGSFPGTHRDMCVKFWGARDVTQNVFPEMPLLSYDVDWREGTTEKKALIGLGRELGASKLEARRAWKAADRARNDAQTKAATRQAEVLAEKDRAKVLVVGHRYILDDKLLGDPIISKLDEQDVGIVRSDDMPDLEAARDAASSFSPSLKWSYNREQIGAVVQLKDQVDGILILVSFPCGPDSLAAELCVRKIDDTPICVVVLDELTGAGGLQTRLESFCDIVRMRRSA
jgi:predicted nucleotide-binding protein (sugar kinase/HSP70/actin superfamily)